MSKKTKAILCLLLTMAITIGVTACSSNSKSKYDTTEVVTDAKGNTSVYYFKTETTYKNVTDKAGQLVTDKKGNAVTEKATYRVPVSNKKTNTNKKEKAETSKNPNTEVGTTNTTTEKVKTTKQTTVKVKGTSQPSTYYTTTQSNALPEDSFDGVFTESSALFFLQGYYGDKYVVNYYPKNNKGDVCGYAVFDYYKTNEIAYTVTVNIVTGKAYQIDTKTNIKSEIKLI